MYVQNGDVNLFQETNFPDGKPVLNGLLHQGQNHAHIIKGNCLICEHEGKTYVNALEDCTLEHEEHGRCDEAYRTLPKGIWRKEIVNEYDHAKEESRKVID